MEKFKIAVICGTAREGRESIKAAKWVAEQGRKRGDTEVIFVDPRNYHLPKEGAPEDGEDPAYSKIVQQADGFYIVTPEYNHSFPSTLKRLFDSEWTGYHHKPIALAGVSSGPWGGVRACEALLSVCHTAWMVNIKPELYFPKIQELFDERNQLKAEHVARYEKAVTAAYDELLWYAKLLKPARQARTTKQ